MFHKIFCLWKTFSRKHKPESCHRAQPAQDKGRNMGLPEPDIIDNRGRPQTEKSKHAPFPAFRSLHRFPEVKGQP